MQREEHAHTRTVDCTSPPATWTGLGFPISPDYASGMQFGLEFKNHTHRSDLFSLSSLPFFFLSLFLFFFCPCFNLSYCSLFLCKAAFGTRVRIHSYSYDTSSRRWILFVYFAVRHAPPPCPTASLQVCSRIPLRLLLRTGCHASSICLLFSFRVD